MENDPAASLFVIPEWVRECPEVKARGIQLEVTLKPRVAWRSPFNQVEVASYAVKVAKQSSQEADIYEELQRYDRASPNHTLPCDIVRCDSDGTILIMPCANTFAGQFFGLWSLSEVLDCFSQTVEGLEFLHEHHVAHLDLRMDNILLAETWEAKHHENLESGKIYIIDFSESRRLNLGPGRQPPIDLPQSIIPKPLDMQHFDPYSFDVYCLGLVFDEVLACVYKKRPQPWILGWYAQWLIGTERGCTGVCRCRPTARRARQVFVVLRWVIRGMTLVENVLRSIRNVFSPSREPPA